MLTPAPPIARPRSSFPRSPVGNSRTQGMAACCVRVPVAVRASGSSDGGRWSRSHTVPPDKQRVAMPSVSTAPSAVQSQLILMRHGESMWNDLKLFTGDVDIPLTEKGVMEALAGGRAVSEIDFDVVFTSRLVRAKQQETASCRMVPVYADPALNERCHGDLQVSALRRNAHRKIKGMVESAQNVRGSTRGNSAGVAPRRGSQIVVHARSGRSALYGDAETYVLMEPGEDEQFVTAEELQEKLKNWLQEWPGETLPIDLTKFENLDEAVQFLVNAVCELELGDGQGSLQWYEVRLE